MAPTLYSSVFKICLCLVVQVWVVQQRLRKIRKHFCCICVLIVSSDLRITFARNIHHFWVCCVDCLCYIWQITGEIGCSWREWKAGPGWEESCTTNNCFLPWMVYSRHSGMFLLKFFLFLYTQSVKRGKAKINPFEQKILS